MFRRDSNIREGGLGFQLKILRISLPQRITEPREISDA